MRALLARRRRDSIYHSWCRIGRGRRWCRRCGIVTVQHVDRAGTWLSWTLLDGSVGDDRFEGALPRCTGSTS